MSSGSKEGIHPELGAKECGTWKVPLNMYLLKWQIYKTVGDNLISDNNAQVASGIDDDIETNVDAAGSDNNHDGYNIFDKAFKKCDEVLNECVANI